MQYKFPFPVLVASLASNYVGGVAGGGYLNVGGVGGVDRDPLGHDLPDMGGQIVDLRQRAPVRLETGWG